MEERKVVVVNEKEYYLDTLDETSSNLLNDLLKIDGEINRITLQKGIADIARTTLLKALTETVEKSETAELVETENK